MAWSAVWPPGSESEFLFSHPWCGGCFSHQPQVRAHRCPLWNPGPPQGASRPGCREPQCPDPGLHDGRLRVPDTQAAFPTQRCPGKACTGLTRLERLIRDGEETRLQPGSTVAPWGAEQSPATRFVSFLVPVKAAYGTRHTAHGSRHTALGTRHSAQDTAHTLGGNSHRQAPRGGSAHPVKALGLEEMAVGTVQLPPSSGATAVDGFWNRDEEAMKSQHGPRPGPTHKVPSGLAAHGR